MALAQCIGLIVLLPNPVAILVKTVQGCILDCLEGTDKIWANRGSMDLRNHGVAPEDTPFCTTSWTLIAYARVRISAYY